MANTVKLKRSAIPDAIPTTGQLDLGEIAINTYNGKIFIKKDNGSESIVEVGGSPSINLNDLTDVTITSPSTDQVIKYNGSAWINGTAPGGSSVYFKDPVRVATTANITLSNTQTIDGVVLTVGDRVLVKNQNTSSENGIYVVDSGSWTRATDANDNTEIQRGVQVYVQYGTINGGNSWQLMASDGNPIVIGTNTQGWLPTNGMLIRGLNSIVAPTASGISAIAIGTSSSSTGNSSIAIGNTAFTGNGTSAIAIGASANTSGCSSSLAIGRYAFVQPNNDSSCAIGYLSKTDMKGEIAFGTGYFDTQGDLKVSIIIGSTTTTNATALEIGVANVSTTTTNRIILVNDSSYIFDCDVIARNTGTDTESKAWNVKFAIRRGTSAANTSLIGSVTKTVIGEDTNTSSWDISVTADTTNGRPKIEVTGEASKTIRWVANIRMTKVTG